MEEDQRVQMMSFENQMPPRIAVSINELSKITSLSESFIRKEIRLGHLEARTAGRRVLVRIHDFEEYLNGGRKAAEDADEPADDQAC
jgi:hypothetical protein